MAEKSASVNGGTLEVTKVAIENTRKGHNGFNGSTDNTKHDNGGTSLENILIKYPTTIENLKEVSSTGHKFDSDSPHIYPDLHLVPEISKLIAALVINQGATQCGSDAGTFNSAACYIDSCTPSGCSKYCPGLPFTNGIPYTFTIPLGCFALVWTHADVQFKYDDGNGKLCDIMLLILSNYDI